MEIPGVASKKVYLYFETLKEDFEAGALGRSDEVMRLLRRWSNLGPIKDPNFAKMLSVGKS